MTHFTPEMAFRANIAIEADLLRRNAKLKRLHPDASPYTNLMASRLDHEEGDPEKTEDFEETARAIVCIPQRVPAGLMGLANSTLNWLGL